MDYHHYINEYLKRHTLQWKISLSLSFSLSLSVDVCVCILLLNARIFSSNVHFSVTTEAEGFFSQITY